MKALPRPGHRISALSVGACVAATLAAAQPAAGQTAAAAASPTAGPAVRAMLDAYCVVCHNERLQTAGLELESLDTANPGPHAEVWEKVVAKLRAGSMPPPGRPRPDAAISLSVAEALEGNLDRAWAANPNPGRIAAVHRLNRVEYNNAVRDLLAFDPRSFDVTSLLPGDETADGSFDNFAGSLSISTAHLERYLSVARQVTRRAIGLPPTSPAIETFEIPLHILQDDRQSEDLPLGSRGGMAVHHDFPVDGEYVIRVRLQRQYQAYLLGMGWPQQLDVRLDGSLLERFTVGGQARGRPAAASFAGAGEVGFAGDPEWEAYMQTGGDEGLEIRLAVDAGPHTVGVSFVRELWEPEGLAQPLQRGRVITNDQRYMGYANVGSVEIGGPYAYSGPAEDTPSRRAIFVCEPNAETQVGGPTIEECATTILSRMARRAYRRPVTEADVETLVEFFAAGVRDEGTFDGGIQFALERMLVDPDFLLRIYREPTSIAPPAAAVTSYRLSDLELASRLSFFLWSSIPDDRLLELAEQGRLRDPSILDAEVRRMLADSRAVDTLAGDFAAQWLNLRRLDDVVVDPEQYPNYDLSLMEGFRRETELFVASTIREDRRVADLLDADYTFANERVARHYGLPGIYGSRFRRVTLPRHGERGGILTHGALLSTTSYPNRTSPVLRGKWLADNVFGIEVPAPPPGVPTLEENEPNAQPASMRERLSRHRQNPSCSSCHAVIDPLGFALENFDVIGGWRTVDESGLPVDSIGTTVGGARVDGLAGLRALLLDRPEEFPRTVTRKLLTYALGRRLEYYDQPTVRQIVADAAEHDYRWSSLVLGIVKSPAFLMRARIMEK